MRRSSVLALFGGMIFASTSILNGQSVSYTLSSNLSDSTKAYVARDYVSMQPGFRFVASSGKTFNAKTDPTLIFPPSQNYMTPSGQLTTNPAQGGVVGSIPGQFAVSPMGGATYTIPIECPAGINGMQPNISLVYNSQGGDGPLGVGWSLSGLSAITCVPKTVFSNNAVSGVDLVSNPEQFALDGQKLFLQEGSGSYGGNGSFYFTENKSISKISSHGSFGTFGPEYFKVVTTDGTVVEYREIVSFDLSEYFLYYPYPYPYQWLISKITDVNGNYVSFSYTSYGRSLKVPASITYGGNVNRSSSTIKIELSYQTKTTIKTNYISGFPCKDALLLKSIHVKSTDATSPEVNLTSYELMYNTKFDRYYLTSIKENGRDGLFFNPTVFDWGEDPVGQEVQGLFAEAIQGNAANIILSDRFASGDVDGDGIDDIIQLYDKDVLVGGGTKVRKSGIRVTKNGLNNSYNELLFDKELPKTTYYTENAISSCNAGILLANLNGSQPKSVLTPFFLSNDAFKRFGFDIVNVDQEFGGTLPNCNEMPAYCSGDFNNDGIDDIMVVGKNRSGGYLNGLIFYLQYQNNNGIPQYNILYDTIQIASNVNISAVFPSDFDNDGLLDFMLVSDNDSKVYRNFGGGMRNDGLVHVSFEEYTITSDMKSNNSAIRPGDFNGDGLMDFLVNEHCNSVWKLLLNKGGWFSSSVVSNITAKQESYAQSYNDKRDECIVVDINRDGKSDIISIDAVYDEDDDWFSDPWGVYRRTNVKWYLSTGSGFTLIKSYTVQDEDYFKRINHTLGDFNGDGLVELFTFDSNLYSGADNSNSGRVYFLSTNHDANKITKITDGLSNEMSIYYQFLTKSQDRFDSSRNFYNLGATSESDYPFANITIPLSCVNRVIAPTNNESLNTQKYAYSGLKMHVSKGLLGFSSWSKADSLTAIKVEKRTTYDEFCLTNYQVQEMQLSTGVAFERTEEWFNNSKTGKVYTSYPSQILQSNLRTGINVLTNSFVFDSWGNKIQSKTTKNNWIEIETNTYGQFGSWSWCPNKTIKKSVWTYLNGSTSTRTSTYGYDANGKLVADTLDPGDVNQKIQRYSNYDVFGHPQTLQILANNNTRTSRFVYSPSGRFLIEKNNEVGDTIHYSWNESLSLLTQESIRDEVTSYEYDGMGKISKSISSEGIKSASGLRWCEPSENYGARYYSFVESSGSPQEKKYYNKLGQELVMQSRCLNDSVNRIFTEYYSDGKIKRISQPTFERTPQAWAWTKTYNEFGQVATHTTPLGTSTFSYNGSKTTENSPSGTVESNLFLNGLVEYTKTNGKKVCFSYDPNGRIKTSTPENGNAIAVLYNLQGNRIKLTDPDAGIVESTYNGFGEMLTQSQKIHNADLVTTNYTYNPTNGQLQNIVRNGETTNYAYDDKNRLLSVSIVGKHSKTFTYGAFNRIIQQIETVGDKTFTFRTEYDALGRIHKETFPSGYFTTNFYDENGFLTEVKDAHGKCVTKPMSENAKGQIIKERRGNIETLYGYNNLGYVDSIYSSGIVHQKYEFDSKGNLGNRQDKLSNQKEVFTYDALNRLTNWNVYRNGLLEKLNAQTYESSTGNISSRSDLDNLTLKYGIGGRPHALDSIAGIPSVLPTANLTVTYTDFKKINTLSEGNRFYELTYGVDEQRLKSVYKVNNSTKLTRYYLGDYEEEVFPNGTVREIHYLSGGAILISTNGQDSLLYGYTDYQGSLIALADENGNVLERYAFDPWGNRRNPSNWTQKDTRTAFLLNRGYTGHEHLDAFSIINMNGRVYDPLTAQFFSPDPFVQAPEDWLNYNRYSYCLNNPLIYADPSGEFLTWSIGKNGISIGLNFTPIGIPLGFGINVGWGNGASTGVYGEVGPRVGGNGFGFGSTYSQSLDFNIKSKSWSTTSSMSSYASLGPAYAGESVSMTRDYGTNQWTSSWNVYAGIGFGNDARGYGFNLGYGSSGFTYGMGGYFDPSSPISTSLKFTPSQEVDNPSNNVISPDGLDEYVNRRFGKKIPKNATVSWTVWDNTDGTTTSPDLNNKNSPLTVKIPRLYLKDPDGLLYDCVAHELKHVNDYASGNVARWYNTYKRWSQVEAIMEYRAYNENQLYSKTYRNGLYDYSKQINKARKNLPVGW